MEANSTIAFSNLPASNGVSFLDSEKLVDENGTEKQQGREKHSGPAIRVDQNGAGVDATTSSKDQDGEDDFVALRVNGHSYDLPSSPTAADESGLPPTDRTVESQNEEMVPDTLTLAALSNDDGNTNEALNQSSGLNPIILEQEDPFTASTMTNADSNRCQQRSGAVDGVEAPLDGSSDYNECVNVPDDNPNVQSVDENHQRPEEHVLEENQSDDTIMHKNTAENSNNFEEGEEWLDVKVEAKRQEKESRKGEQLPEHVTGSDAIGSQEMVLDSQEAEVTEFGDFDAATEVAVDSVAIEKPHNDEVNDLSIVDDVNHMKDEGGEDALQTNEGIGKFNEFQNGRTLNTSVEEGEDFGEFGTAEDCIDKEANEADGLDEFGSFEANKNAPVDEDDEFGGFGTTDDKADEEIEDDFGEFDDGGIGGGQDLVDDDDFGEFGESNGSKEATNGSATSDPVVQNVRTAFFRLFPRPEVESETNQDAEVNEAMAIGDILVRSKGVVNRMLADFENCQQNYSEIETEDSSGTIGLSKLRSLVRDVHAHRDDTECAPEAVKVYGHDRNPFVAPLKASDCRLTTDFPNRWFDLNKEKEEIAPVSSPSTQRDVEEFTKLIPDLSFMLSDRLCLPN